MQAGHPCAEKAPWIAPSAEAGGHQHHVQDAPAPADSGQPGHHCECVGACQGTAVTVGPAGLPVLVVAAVRVEAPARFAPRVEAPYTRPDRLLPPANAPPLS